MAFSLDGCSLSSGCSSIEQKAGVSYGLNRIKSYQVQLMSSVLYARPRLERIQLLSAWQQFCERILFFAWEQRYARLQSNAGYAKPGGCETMLNTLLKNTCGKDLPRNPPRARSQCDPRCGSLSIIAACPQVYLWRKRQPPTRSTGSSHIKSKWCHLFSWFMCPLRSSMQVLEQILLSESMLNTLLKKHCGKALQQNPPRARSQCDPRYGSLSIIAACPQDSRSKRQPPTRSAGSSHINSKWCRLSSWFMCPSVHPCKSSNKSCCLCWTHCLKKTEERICNEIHHVQGHSATPNVVLCQSLQLVLRFICGGSGSLLRAQQDQVISSPNDVTCPLDSCPLRSSMQVLEQILLSMLNTLLKKTVEKICNEIHHVQGHSATPKHAVLCQSLQLVLRFICGGSGSLLRAQQDQVIASPNDVTCSLDSCVPYVHPCKSSNKSCCLCWTHCWKKTVEKN